MITNGLRSPGFKKSGAEGIVLARKLSARWAVGAMDESPREIHIARARTQGSAAPQRADRPAPTKDRAAPVPTLLAGPVADGSGQGMMSPLEVSVTVKPHRSASEGDNTPIRQRDVFSNGDGKPGSNGHGGGSVAEITSPLRAAAPLDASGRKEQVASTLVGGSVWMTVSAVDRLLQQVRGERLRGGGILNPQPSKERRACDGQEAWTRINA